MIDRRSFFKNILVAAVAPSLLLSISPDKFKWKRQASSGIYVINPEWVNAPYEICFVGSPSAGFRDITPVILPRAERYAKEKLLYGTDLVISDAYPVRLMNDGKTVVPCMIKL
jgi:hypothetical protein